MSIGEEVQHAMFQSPAALSGPRETPRDPATHLTRRRHSTSLIFLTNQVLPLLLLASTFLSKHFNENPHISHSASFNQTISVNVIENLLRETQKRLHNLSVACIRYRCHIFLYTVQRFSFMSSSPHCQQRWHTLRVCLYFIRTLRTR